jgi:hypothetical protein
VRTALRAPGLRRPPHRKGIRTAVREAHRAYSRPPRGVHAGRYGSASQAP